MERSRKSSAKERLVSALKAGIVALSVSNSTAPGDLLCRDANVKSVVDFFGASSTNTLQIFGMPGTGKTASVHYALAHFAAKSGAKPTAVFLNGYVIQKRSDIYWTLNQHLTKARGGGGANLPPEQCASNIDKHFATKWAHPPALCVIIIDEVDKVVQKHPAGLLRIMEWLTKPNANCKLITISNSMELPADAKTRSRFDSTQQVVFSPYIASELKEILLHRISRISPKLFSDQAVNILCHQTAHQCGDVRWLLQSASAAICGVLMKVEEGFISDVPETGLVAIRDIHSVTQRIFNDRFMEFINAVKAPALFVTIGVIAKETEELFQRNECDSRLRVERTFIITQDRLFRTLGVSKQLTRASYCELIDTLQEVGLVDLSMGEDRMPVRHAAGLFESSEDVFISLLQPFQTVLDACRLHNEFGTSIGSQIL